MARLRLQDVKGDQIIVRGKTGLRNIPKHTETDRIIERWMEERERLIEEARKYKPDIEVPDNLIIYKNYKEKPVIGAYGERSNSLDRKTRMAMERKYGIRIPNHSLRRWFGRTMDALGADVSVIQRIYGHSSESETHRYIGTKFKQMGRALKLLDVNRLKGILEEENE